MDAQLPLLGCIQRRHWIALQPVQEPTKNPIPQMNILKQTMLKKL